ncbi:MAG: RtcB family protein [Desulfovibrionales bacterium]|nr:RtcB family protein [Desulfovibrionales bacterium]
MPFRLSALGMPEALQDAVLACVRELEQDGVRGKALRRLFRGLAENPASFLEHPVLGTLAAMLRGAVSQDTPVPLPRAQFKPHAPWRVWGEDLDPKAVEQMNDGCSLPVAVSGALMPDAHVGYGLPIGGVLAVDEAVIPYGVGMDIACRVKMSVFAVTPDLVDTHQRDLIRAIEQETSFGVGARFRIPKDHPVMHEDWKFSSVIARMKETAREQLGTSGAGNHFVEWGVLDVPLGLPGLAAGTYLAFLSHSGSRGTGGEVAKYYSALARRLHPELPRSLGHLAWLALDTDAGREYWAAMELMGRYSAANHALIHAAVGGHLGLSPVWGVENHHNFAWREIHGGRQVIVHRKGATPAGAGVFGVIPGTMVHPAYVVEGLGNPLALCSAAHGAGRAMSRQEASSRYRRSDLDEVLDRHGVRLLSAGLDEVPMAYKDIRTVMAAQSDLVRIVATFIPRIVKMAN